MVDCQSMNFAFRFHGTLLLGLDLSVFRLQPYDFDRSDFSYACNRVLRLMEAEKEKFALAKSSKAGFGVGANEKQSECALLMSACEWVRRVQNVLWQDSDMGIGSADYLCFKLLLLKVFQTTTSGRLCWKISLHAQFHRFSFNCAYFARAVGHHPCRCTTECRHA